MLVEGYDGPYRPTAALHNGTDLIQGTFYRDIYVTDKSIRSVYVTSETISNSGHVIQKKLQ